MSSQAHNGREDERRLDLRTLVIASVASAVAAIVVSRIWRSGTPIAAAATPVLVTILKEMLDRPTAKIAAKVTADSKALPATRVREPAASRVGRDSPPAADGPTRSLPPTEPGGDTVPADIRVYRQKPTGSVTSRINPKVALITGLLAFVIAGVVLTAGQLAIGNPFGHDGNGAIILGQHKKSRVQETEPQNTTTEPQQTTTEPQQTNPQETTPDNQKTTTTPSSKQRLAPQQTTPQAAPRNQTQTTPTTPAP